MLALEQRGAVFSPDRVYRYILSRCWDDHQPFVAFIGLNPSTATEDVDDPTVRRCLAFVRAWGFGGLWMLNLFGLRSTDPSVLYHSPDPVGVGEFGNTAAIISATGDPRCGMIVAAWGNHGALHQRGREVLALLDALGLPVHCLGYTLSHHPKHPLYLKSDTRPILITPAGEDV